MAQSHNTEMILIHYVGSTNFQKIYVNPILYLVWNYLFATGGNSHYLVLYIVAVDVITFKLIIFFIKTTQFFVLSLCDLVQHLWSKDINIFY